MSFFLFLLVGNILLLPLEILADEHRMKNIHPKSDLGHAAQLARSPSETIGTVLSQKIEGKEIFDGNKAQIQSHNYDSHNGLFFQTQYNGDVMNLVIPNQKTTEPSTTMEHTTSCTENATTVTTEPTTVTTLNQTTSMPTQTTTMSSQTTTTMTNEMDSSTFSHTTLKPTVTGPEDKRTTEKSRGKDVKPGLEHAKDFFHIGERKSHKSVIQQHFYDGRSGILLQNQYNGNVMGMNPPTENFQSPLVLLMSLLQGGVSPFLRGRDETKTNPSGHHIPSGSDAQVKVHNRNSLQNKPLNDGAAHSSPSFGLSPFLSHIKDMVTNDRHRDNNEKPLRLSASVDADRDSFVHNLFKEEAKTVNRVQSLMERVITALGFRNSDIEKSILSFNDSPLDETNSTDESGDGSLIFTGQPVNETATENGDNASTPVIEVDKFPANIRVNAFNVASGGQAYQIILENPDIKINVMEPEDEDNEDCTTEQPTSTTDFPFPWNFFSGTNE